MEQRGINTVSDKCFLLFTIQLGTSVLNENNVQIYRGGDTRNELFKGSQLGALCPKAIVYCYRIRSISRPGRLPKSFWVGAY